MNICFIMYPWDAVEPETDSTLRMIHEAASRGHRVAILNPRNLTIRNSVPSGFCRFIDQKGPKVHQAIPTFYKKVTFKEQLVPMSGFDIIFVRTNPPLDPTMLNFLDSVKDDTFIMNDINGLRKASNKLYPASFEDPNNEIIPITHVSKNKSYLKKMIQESEKNRMILKPLDGFGGSGVIVLEKGAMQNVNSLLDFYINEKDKDHYVILQEYIDGAEQGDIRVLMLNGEPIGAMRRIPSKDDVRSNVHVGGKAVKHVLTKNERALCKKIGPKLVSDGLYFVGIDIIADKLIEVNVCSPGGITRINKFNRTKLQQKILDFAENVVKYKETAIERKRSFRKTIEDA